MLMKSKRGLVLACLVIFLSCFASETSQSPWQVYRVCQTPSSLTAFLFDVLYIAASRLLQACQRVENSDQSVNAMQGAYNHLHTERNGSPGRGVDDRQLLDLSENHLASTLKTYLNSSELVRA